MPVIPETPTIPQSEYKEATERWNEFIKEWIAFEQANIGNRKHVAKFLNAQVK